MRRGMEVMEKWELYLEGKDWVWVVWVKFLEVVVSVKWLDFVSIRIYVEMPPSMK